jgi:hypothetical protein
MPVNRSYLEMKHILCQVKIGRRLSLALNDLSMKTGRRPRVRNSEFAASRPSYRTDLGSDISRDAVKYLLPSGKRSQGSQKDGTKKWSGVCSIAFRPAKADTFCALCSFVAIRSFFCVSPS